MSQNDQMMSHLIHHDSITQREAEMRYGIGRAAARVENLRAGGVPIISKIIEVTKANGKIARIAEYSMGLPDRLEYVLALRDVARVRKDDESAKKYCAEIAVLRERIDRMKEKSCAI